MNEKTAPLRQENMRLNKEDLWRLRERSSRGLRKSMRERSGKSRKKNSNSSNSNLFSRKAIGFHGMKNRDRRSSNDKRERNQLLVLDKED